VTFVVLDFRAFVVCDFESGELMTPAAFRKIALELPETEERSHMDHPDFRVAGKIFATLGYPDKTRGMVKLAPEDQHNFSQDYPDAFVPVKGTWGRRGATSVYLKNADAETLTRAIRAAWRNTAPKRLLKDQKV
jgi:hypothetical protein